MKIKNLEEALICFKENAIIHGECTQNGDYKRGNKSHKNIINAIKYISAEHKYEIIEPLLEDNNLSVRIWAAYALLHVNTPKAVKALKEIVKTDSGIMGFNAEMTLDEFKKGNI